MLRLSCWPSTYTTSARKQRAQIGRRHFGHKFKSKIDVTERFSLHSPVSVSINVVKLIKWNITIAIYEIF